VPDGDYRAFVRARLPQAEGVIADAAGNVVGRHEGVAGFTVGQRRGIGVAVGEKRFVTGIDPELNVITIGREEDLMARSLQADRVSWTSAAPAGPMRCDAKIRYRTPAATALVEPLTDGRARVTFEQAQRAITPGQAVVFYDGDQVLGGGVIAGVER
jgi:tRNA-specific 2-thiouridylase